MFIDWLNYYIIQFFYIVKATANLRPSLRILWRLFLFVYVILLQSFSDIFIAFRVYCKILKKRIVSSSSSFFSFINVQHSDPYKDISNAVSVMWNVINLFFGIRSFFDSFYFCMNQTYFKQPIIIHLSKILYAEFYENLNFLLVPTIARHSSVSWASWVSALCPYYIFTYFCNNKRVWHRDNHATIIHTQTKR